MKVRTWLILAAVLILVGAIMFGGVMMACNWNFLKLQNLEFETSTYSVQEPFSHISISVDTTDVTVCLTEENTASVVCFEQKKIKHTVEVKDDTLTVREVDTRAWYEHIGIAFHSSKVTVYLPRAVYGAVTIEGSTSDLQIDSLCAKSLNLSLSTGDITVNDIKTSGGITSAVSTGDINLTDIQCHTFTASASTGDIHLKNTVADQEFSVQTKTGGIFLEGCDAARLTIKASTGDIVGWLLSPKTFIAQTDTGSVHVPMSTNGGLCEIHTQTGDIDIDAITAP